MKSLYRATALAIFAAFLSAIYISKSHEADIMSDEINLSGIQTGEVKKF